MEEKAIISLVSVIIGWLLAQGTALTKDVYTGWKLKKSLLKELEDIKEQLRRLLMIYHRQLQVYALEGIDPGVPIPVPNLFFKQYYKDVFSRLKREQRLSYQLIHGMIDTLNSENADFLKFTKQTVEDLKHLHLKKNPEFSRAVDLWGDRVMALYSTTRETIWHIECHLKKPHCPALDLMGPMHKSYVQFVDEVNQEMKKIIESAKGLKREDFEKIYDEQFFHRKSSS
ncbi:MAG: hypothetical protein IT388_00690 [Nitrospirales bacterium]|nr:hypothetical protein [Nitrospirales bacterium]